MSKLRPLSDRVVVSPDEPESTTKGGIILPDNAKEKQTTGTVISAGPGKLLASGERSAVAVKAGDRIVYGKYTGSEIEVDGAMVKVIGEADILAVLE